ncbi:MAG TPA: isoaspartyl peptidase/L-asparaginase, partial [Bacteroidales bacterium]|nr:isoaspartyl peptidase/L-asparaginase [Bacteroidales bacterium]
MKNIVLLIILTMMSLSFSGCRQTEPREEWAIVLHGGAGSARSMAPEVRDNYLNLLDQALEVGTQMLQNGAEALDVATRVVVWMEDCPAFNAGKGAVVTSDGIHELDAAVMDGSNLMAGAVAGVRDIKNPILAARHVMEDSPHVLLIGEGASSFAESMGLPLVENAYFSTPERLEQIRRIKMKKEEPDPKGTVGCVVLDSKGNLAAATSTGGMS